MAASRHLQDQLAPASSVDPSHYWIVGVVGFTVFSFILVTIWVLRKAYPEIHYDWDSIDKGAVSFPSDFI